MPRALGLLVVAALATVAGSARAQKIDVVDRDRLPRLSREGGLLTKRAPAQMPEGVSFADCVEDQRIRFTLALSAVGAGGRVEAWATEPDTSCLSVASREGPRPSCWPLARGVEGTPLVTLDVPVRALIAGVVPSADASAPEIARSCGPFEERDILVEFLYFAPGEPSTPAASERMLVQADTLGPPTPTGVRAEPTADGVKVAWDELPVATPQYLGAQGVRVFASPAEEGSGACRATGLSSVPSARGDGTPDPSFVDRFLTAETSTPIPRETIVSSVSGEPVAGAGGERGRTYAFAVAAADRFGNIGPLTPPICAAAAKPPPEGGGCKSVPGTTGGALPAIAGICAFAVFAAARRRSRTPV